MAHIQDELDRLNDAELNPTDVNSAELLTEELAARAFNYRYTWDSDTLTATIVPYSGLQLSMTANETRSKIRLDASWKKTGIEDHSSVKKWLPQAINQISAKLRKSGWKVSASSRDVASLTLRSEISCGRIRADLDFHSDAISEVARILDFR